MRLFSLAFVLFSASFIFASETETTIVIGQIPGQYVFSNNHSDFNRKKLNSYLGYVVIQNRVFTEVDLFIHSDEGEDLQAEISDLKSKYPKAIVLQPKSGHKRDILYPGLIDLHNHTKQNNLKVWELAEGQFQNRFEWREWRPYKKSVSSNMNPWISYHKSVYCAAFRWSELQAMILGTTYLQGPSSCVKNFAIHRVENPTSYISEKDPVKAPTDIILPEDMVYVSDELAPLINEGQSYEQALSLRIRQLCPGFDSEERRVTAENVNSREMLRIFGDQEKLMKYCGIESKSHLRELVAQGKFHKRFFRYIYWIHKTVAGKKRALDKDNRSALIGHLAEGRRDDPYNQTEFQMLDYLGLVRPGVNLVHAMGVDRKGLEKMHSLGMGIIWSPFSNFILYEQTLNLEQVAEVQNQPLATGSDHSGLLLALGSDWTPTGSKNVLDELKVARRYIQQNNLESHYNDEELFKMVSENPARMINHWHNKEQDGQIIEAGIGRLKVGSMGSLIAVEDLPQSSNPYTNLVAYAGEEQINLVVVDGLPLYGNKDVFDRGGLTEYEMLSVTSNMNLLLTDSAPGALKSASKEVKTQHVLKLIQMGLDQIEQLEKVRCDFTDVKVMKLQDSGDGFIQDFKEESNLNLDRFEHIQLLLAMNLLSQSKNQNPQVFISGPVDPDFAVEHFVGLYSCNNNYYKKRLSKPFSEPLEFLPRDRQTLRSEQGLGKVPKKLAEAYSTVLELITL